MNGECRTAKVLEIAPDYITFVPLSESGAPFVDANETILKKEVILIEFKSGAIEVYNTPKKSLIYNANGTVRKEAKEGRDVSFNFASVNTLALCNSDISVFYERITSSKKVGFGCMAAYNFNSYVVFPNAMLAFVANAKKNYDIGAFINLYPTHFRSRTTFYFGGMIKYMAFSFSKTEEEKIGTAVNIKYTDAKGGQTAVLFTIGTQTYLGQNLFLKTIAGLGAFGLSGDYKQQFNYFLNKDRDPRDPEINISVLPKIYFGLNLGFSF